jgi:hypothetical protein
MNGVITYTGEQVGPIRISAVSVGGVPATGATVTVSGPGVYRMEGVTPFMDYEVSAVLDANANFVQDFWEAGGAWTGNPARVAAADLDHVDFALTDPVNHEGLPLWWLKDNLGVSDANDTGLYRDADDDADGVSNWAEYLAGTDPKNAASQFEIGNGAITNAEDSIYVVLQWKSVLNRTYAVWRAMDLANGFTLLERNIPGRPPVNTYPDPTATNAGPYFYKIGVEK